MNATLARSIEGRLEEGIGSAKTEATVARVIGWRQEGGIGSEEPTAKKAKQREEHTKAFVAYYKHKGKIHKPARGVANTSQVQRKTRSMWLYLTKSYE